MEDADPSNRPCMVVGNEPYPCRGIVLIGNLKQCRHYRFHRAWDWSGPLADG